MTDFFTRLTGRTLGIIPVAQPVIASMFAPQNNWNSSVDASVGGVAVEIEQAISPPSHGTQTVSRPPTLTEEPSVQLPHDVRHPRSVQQHTRNGMVAPVSPVQESASNRLQVEHLEPQVQAFSEAHRDIHLRMPAPGELPAFAVSSSRDTSTDEDIQVMARHQDHASTHASTQAASASQMFEEENTDNMHKREAVYSQEDAPRREAVPSQEDAFRKQIERIVTQEAEQDTRNVLLRKSTVSPHTSAPIPTIPTRRRLSSRGGRQTPDGESASIPGSTLPSTLQGESVSIPGSTLQGMDHDLSNLSEMPQLLQQAVTEIDGLEQLLETTHITTYGEKKASADILQGNGLEHFGTHPHDETQTREYTLQEIRSGGSRKVEAQRTRSQQPEEAVWKHAEMQSAQTVTHAEPSGVTGSAQHKTEYAPPTQSPTIRVTIGRIDVRAVTTPTPAPDPRKGRQEPKVSLKQYLGRQQ